MRQPAATKQAPSEANERIRLRQLRQRQLCEMVTRTIEGIPDLPSEDEVAAMIWGEQRPMIGRRIRERADELAVRIKDRAEPGDPSWIAYRYLVDLAAELGA